MLCFFSYYCAKYYGEGIRCIPNGILEKQIIAIIEDIGTDAIKIGILHSLELWLTL
jgi:hydroxymethylpyrimidine/phosphomethylpyrimidine kinase